MANPFDIGIIIKAIDQASGPIKTMLQGTEHLFQGSLGRIGTLVERNTALIRGLGIGMMAAGAAGAAAFGMGIKSAAHFQSGLTEVSTLVDTTKVDMKELGEGVKRVGIETGQGLDVMTKGLYQTISAGIPAADALKFLSLSAKAATAGVTSTAIAVDGLSSVVNAFGVGMAGASQIADQMFTTVRLGKTTFGELSAAIGQVASMAAAANVSTQELFAGLASLTVQGINTSEAVTGLRAMIKGIISPQDDAVKAASSLGIAWGSSALQAEGLSGVLADVRAKTGGNIEIIRQLFPDVQALGSALALTGDGFVVFTNNLDEMKRALGETEKAYGKMAGTAEVAYSRLKVALEALKIAAGEPLLGRLTNLAKSLTKLIDSARLFAETPLGNTLSRLGAITATILVSLGGLALALGLLGKTFRTLFGAGKILLMALGAIAAFFTGGTIASVVAMGAAILGVGYAIYRVFASGNKHVEKATAKIRAYGEEIQKLEDVAAGKMAKAWPQVPQGTTAAVEAKPPPTADEIKAAREREEMAQRQVLGASMEHLSRIRNYWEYYAEQEETAAEARRNLIQLDQYEIVQLQQIALTVRNQGDAWGWTTERTETYDKVLTSIQGKQLDIGQLQRANAEREKKAQEDAISNAQDFADAQATLVQTQFDVRRSAWQRYLNLPATTLGFGGIEDARKALLTIAREELAVLQKQAITIAEIVKQQGLTADRARQYAGVQAAIQQKNDEIQATTLMTNKAWEDRQVYLQAVFDKTVELAQREAETGREKQIGQQQNYLEALLSQIQTISAWVRGPKGEIQRGRVIAPGEEMAAYQMGVGFDWQWFFDRFEGWMQRAVVREAPTVNEYRFTIDGKVDQATMDKAIKKFTEALTYVPVSGA